ncbi:MAG: DUF4418 family protein [Selenomonas sp.]|nr:DUF4418 family protein [Selenomonas sp.]
MSSEKKRIGACPLLQSVLNAIFFVGIQTIFAPCAPHEEGKWTTCHWAGEALLGIAAVMLVMSLLHLLPLRTGMKEGLVFAMIPVSFLIIVLPGRLIPLCMMETMRCHVIMQPAVTVIAVLNIVLSAVYLWQHRKEEHG